MTITDTFETRIDDRGDGPAPSWLRPLLVWRVLLAGGLAVLCVLVLIGTGVVVDPPIRWALALAFAGAAFAAGRAVLWTRDADHRGRLAGFVLDGLTALVAAFIALNRMDAFTGLDSVGEAFNSSWPLAMIIVVGFLVTGFAQRGEVPIRNLLRAGRWIMLGGLVLLALDMGVVQMLLEGAQRIVDVEVLPFAVVAVLAGVLCRILYDDGARRWFRSTQDQSETMDGLLFAAPNLLGFLTFFAGPLVASLFFSFTDWDGLTDPEFVGLQNYIDLLSDDLFLKSLRNILIFGLIAIPAAVVPAMVLAALLNAKLPGMKVFRAVYFLPSIAGVVGVTLIWRQLFNSTVGYLNYMILRITDAWNAVTGADATAPQPQWISDADIALFAVIILFAWQQIGFNTVLFLAGMQGIDKSLYEAAAIDGAGTWTQFRRITIPLLAPTTVFVVATTTILGLQMFNEPFILQAPSDPSGPNNSTLTPVIYLYQNAFQEFEIGYASAVAWAMFLLIFAITLLYFRRSGDEGALRA
ncbi:MAG: sugar ABC transporter permease [Actinomycetota bacterium]